MTLRNKINIISTEFFQAILTTYLMSIIVDMLSEGKVSNFIDVNRLLVLVLISGLMMVTTE